MGIPWLVFFATGALYALLRWRSNSTAAAALMHAAYNGVIAVAMLHTSFDLTESRTCFTHSSFIFNNRASAVAEKQSHGRFSTETDSTIAEVNMSGALVENATIPTRFHQKRSDYRSSSAQSITKKLTHSEERTEPGSNGMSTNLDDVTFLRLPEVKAITGLSKTSVYALIRGKSFPAPVSLGPRAVAWVRSEVRQWALERVHASRSAA
jgi:prophage regulatory protein